MLTLRVLGSLFVTSLPSSKTRPRSGISRPAIMRRVVVYRSPKFKQSYKLAMSNQQIYPLKPFLHQSSFQYSSFSIKLLSITSPIRLQRTLLCKLYCCQAFAACFSIVCKGKSRRICSTARALLTLLALQPSAFQQAISAPFCCRLNCCTNLFQLGKAGESMLLIKLCLTLNKR